MDKKTRDRLNAILEEMAKEAEIQNNILASKYGMSVINTVLRNSEAKNFTDATKEWPCATNYGATDKISCHLCGRKKCKEMYLMENALNQNILLVCVDCIDDFMWCELPLGRKK